jgi:hypothetical protein
MDISKHYLENLNYYNIKEQNYTLLKIYQLKQDA